MSFSGCDFVILSGYICWPNDHNHLIQLKTIWLHLPYNQSKIDYRLAHSQLNWFMQASILYPRVLYLKFLILLVVYLCVLWHPERKHLTANYQWSHSAAHWREEGDSISFPRDDLSSPAALSSTLGVLEMSSVWLPNCEFSD